jgi:asparagine synthase (glutamine-hydrolysing)
MFAGLFRRDGGEVAASDVVEMVQGLPGPPGRGVTVWADGSIAAGSPAGIHRAGELALAGEFLLTNSAALTTGLGVPSGTRPTDADLILAAYRRWGEGFPERLAGDFSFVLWDGRRQRLLCVRDALGIKPFYYHLGPRTCAFGSDADALLCLREVPRRLNAQVLAGYCTAAFADRTATGFLDISRLAPGETLLVDAERATLRSYWSPDPTIALRRGTDAEYEEAFRLAISDAVAGRMGPASVGVALSGGLDSSALACVAGHLEPPSLHAYTAVFGEHSASDERAWVRATVRRSRAIARQCDPAGTSPLADWEGASWRGSTPACNPQISVCRVTLEAAARDDVTVMLHGFGGDSVVSYGLAYLAELVGSGRFIRAAVETQALHRRHGLSRQRLLRAYALSPFVPDRVRRARNAVRKRPLVGHQALLLPAAARRLGLGDHEDPPRPRSARQEHDIDLRAGIHAHVLEASHRVDAVTGVERRYPFLDRRLVELCLSLPGDQKLRDGWTRSIMRRALADVLPEEVRRRPGKANLSPPFIRALRTTDRAAIEAVVARPGALAEWIDPATLAALWQRCLAGEGEREWFAMWRVTVASRWLIHHGFDEERRS